MAGEPQRYLCSRDCYVGQIVYWVMWIDEEDANKKTREGKPYTGCYSYRPGLSPEVWRDRVVSLPKNWSIMLERYGKAYCVSKCELDAVLMEYRSFCSFHLCDRWSNGNKLCDLFEASRVLKMLSDLEEGIHKSHAMTESMEAPHGR
jgi:hypothetical protein